MSRSREKYSLPTQTIIERSADDFRSKVKISDSLELGISLFVIQLLMSE